MSDRMEKERHNDKRQKDGSQWRSHVSVPLFLRGRGGHLIWAGQAGVVACHLIPATTGTHNFQ